MTIREYFASIEDLDARFEAEETAWALAESDDEAFESWAEAEGIDLGAMDEEMGESVLTLWSWDMCGD